MIFGGGGRGGLERRVADGIATLPSWQVFVGSRWVCPFCLTVVKPASKEKAELIEAAVNHLDECQSFRGGEGIERPLKELTRFAAYRRLRKQCKQSIMRSPAWQLLDVSRRWVCPYCAAATHVTVPTSSRMTDETLSAIVDHVEVCPRYEGGRGRELPLSQLKDALRSANQVNQLAENVRQKLEGDPAWRRRDASNRWICPYCSQSQPAIDLSSRVVMFEQAPRQIAAHLRTCAPYLEGAAPQPYEGASSRSGGFQVVAEDAELDELDRRPPPLPSAGGPSARTQARASAGWDDADVPLLPLDELPLAPVSETGPVASETGRWGRDGDLALRGAEPPGRRKTLAELESSGEFLLIDDPEVRDLTRKDQRGELDSWREEIERSLANVRSSSSSRLSALRSLEEPPSDVQPQALDLSGFGLELGRLERATNPARGDFVDALELGRGRMALVAGSVTGDEAETPLLAELARRRIAERAGPDMDPGALLRAVNQEIFADLDGRSFVAVCYALVDLGSRRVMISRAGGPEPLVMHPREGLRVVDCDGMVMGVAQGPAFESHLDVKSLQLGDEDLLVLYANGVLEARGAGGKQLGLPRVQELVRRYGTHEVAYLVDKFQESFELHVNGGYGGGEAFLVALKRHNGSL
ncbi:MAG: PP2C family protein-serine/threonine phosphatase [Planctomycetota bacterium]